MEEARLKKREERRFLDIAPEDELLLSQDLTLLEAAPVSQINRGR